MKPVDVLDSAPVPLDGAPMPSYKASLPPLGGTPIRSHFPETWLWIESQLG